VQASERLIAQHTQVVTLGFIAEECAAVLERRGFLAEGGSRVLELSLQLEDFLTDL